MDMFRGERVILAGDFNAWSIAWGSKETDWRGEKVEEFAESLGLNLANIGNRPTCVRTYG